jgi:NAD(P)-dependent dehydrogenase (short-subunit alcohol dehydrogenase family)/phosphoglycerate dehydrogenase-like enzyme
MATAAERGITVTHTGYTSTPTIELTWALILASARHIPSEAASVRGGGWQCSLGDDMAEKTLGVIGLGNVGSGVAKVGLAFGMKVIAWSQNLTSSAAAAAGARLVSKEDLLRTADVVSIHMVLSSRTVGLIGAAELALMKRSARLVNTSRGPLVVEAALLDALATHRIAGAAIDVYDVEPLPEDTLTDAPRMCLPLPISAMYRAVSTSASIATASTTSAPGSTKEKQAEENTMGKLERKIALVTGGTSGIGFATAKHFVNDGAHVFVTGRRDAELAAAVKEIGRNVTGVKGDVSNLGDLDRLFAQIKQEKDKLDIVFANAGTAKYAPFGKITEELFDSIFNTNVKGLLFTVQKALPLLPDDASIILNASIVASKGLSANSVYSATKAAVRSFARTWTTDLKDRRIRVNAVSPGSIDTPGLSDLLASSEAGQQRLKMISTVVPLGRLGTPDEIAKAVIFLASDDASSQPTLPLASALASRVSVDSPAGF